MRAPFLMNESGASATQLAGKRQSSRHALLDLAPLELDCMNTLWPMGEGTVREIRDRLAERLPRAYTTIMTIMERLARKGVVERHKAGRAYVYRANLSAEDAGSQALRHVVDKFFGGSKDALIKQLGVVTAASQVRAARAGSASTGTPSASSEELQAVSEAPARAPADPD